MSTPDSLSPSPLTSLGDHSHKKLIDDDYSTGKATIKAKSVASSAGFAQYKGWLNLTKNNSPSQEIRIQFPYKTNYVWFATREEETKLHIDFGKYKVVKDQNIFANVQFYNSSVHPTFRLGAVYKGEKCLSHARLEWKNQADINLLLRAQVKNNNWIYTIVEQVCLNKKQFNSLDLLVGYQTPEYDVYFRHLTAQKANFPLFSNFGIGRLVLDVLYRKNGNTYGVEAEFTKLDQYRFLLAASTKKNGVDLKGRVDILNKTLGLVAKGKLVDRFNWTLSAAVPIDGSKPKQVGLFPLPLGFTLDTSV